MAQDKRIGWLAELVAGDKVMVWGDPISICRVVKVTPAGCITVANDHGEQKFDAGGWLMGAGFWGETQLRQLPPKADADIKE